MQEYVLAIEVHGSVFVIGNSAVQIGVAMEVRRQLARTRLATLAGVSARAPLGTGFPVGYLGPGSCKNVVGRHAEVAWPPVIVEEREFTTLVRHMPWAHSVYGLQLVPVVISVHFCRNVQSCVCRSKKLRYGRSVCRKGWPP